MKNSKKQEKSRGILAIARDTDQIQYSKIAEKTLPIASKTLDLPYTVLQINSDSGSIRYDTNLEEFVEWKNTGRYSVYELTPYHETLVIDVDYLIYADEFSDRMNLPDWDYLLSEHAVGVDNEVASLMGQHQFPTIWATVFAFKKTNKAKQFFELVEKIQKNWDYYRHLYMIEQSNFRNDHAFRIADSILSGYVTACSSTFNNSVFHVTGEINKFTVDPTGISIVTDVALRLPLTNLHIFDKQFLMSEFRGLDAN